MVNIATEVEIEAAVVVDVVVAGEAEEATTTLHKKNPKRSPSWT